MSILIPKLVQLRRSLRSRWFRKSTFLITCKSSMFKKILFSLELSDCTIHRETAVSTKLRHYFAVKNGSLTIQIGKQRQTKFLGSVKSRKTTSLNQVLLIPRNSNPLSMRSSDMTPQRKLQNYMDLQCSLCCARKIILAAFVSAKINFQFMKVQYQRSLLKASNILLN